jgi:hypothetical protein
MFTIDIANQADGNSGALRDFPEFIGAEGAIVILLFNGGTVGAAQVVFGKYPLIKKLALSDGFGGEDIRRFFIRSLVLKLTGATGECGWIYSAVSDPLFAEIGFLPSENGLRCRADRVNFKKMCGE